MTMMRLFQLSITFKTTSNHPALEYLTFGANEVKWLGGINGVGPPNPACKSPAGLYPV